MIVFAILVLLPSTADACPNCKDSLYENYVSMAFGFSVIFMMAMPFSILGAWVFYVARIARIDRAKALVSS